MAGQLTGFESDFAEQQPRCVEEELYADEASHAIRQNDNNVAREVDEVVASMIEDDRLGGVEVSGVRQTDPDDSPTKHPHVAVEHVVAVKSDSGEAARSFKLEDDRDRLSRV